MKAKRGILVAAGATFAAVAVVALIGARIFWPSNCAASGPASSYQDASKKAVTEADLVPAMLSGEFYNDRYTIESYFEGGIEIYTSAFITNFGMGDGKLKFKSRVRLPEDRTLRGGDKELGQGKWSFEKSPFVFEADGQKIAGSPKRLEVSGSGEGYRFELVYEPSVPAWRPGNGRVTFGSKENFLDTLLIQPKSKVTGWLEVDGERRELKGYGYAMRTYGNVAPHDAATRQLDVRSIDGSTVLYLRHFKAPEAAGGAEMGFVLVAKAGKVLYESTDFRVQYGEMVTDNEHENKYQVPEKLLIQDETDGKTLTLGIVAKKRTGREDMHKSLSAVEKAVVGKFAKPVSYTYQSAFEVEIGGTDAHKGKGKARYEFNHINK